MVSVQLDITPYTINAVSMVIVSMVSVFYLLRLEEKTIPSWLFVIGLVSFTASMVCMFLTSLILWGSAFNPFTDAFSVLSMAIMIEFAFRFPSHSVSILSRIIRIFIWGEALIALALSGDTAFQILALHHFEEPLPGEYYLLNFLGFLLALVVCVSRSISIQSYRPRGIGGAVYAFVHPKDRPARLLRNLSLALSIGIIQGVVSAFGMPGVFSAATLINLSLLFMLAAIVYASFDFPTQQPSLVVRLVGLTLVTVLAILGIVALSTSTQVERWRCQILTEEISDTTQALLAGQLQAVPEDVAYILAWPSTDQAPGAGRLVVANQVDFDPKSLLKEASNTTPQISPVWTYAITGALSAVTYSPGLEMNFRYGENQPGTYYQYAGYDLDLNGTRYEIGFNLAELSRMSQSQGEMMILVIIGSAFFIIFLFPIFIRSILIHPLDRLLTGVHQAETGDLDVHIPVTHNDEVGYLTTAFNNMAASLKTELDGRQRAEKELRQLNLHLEARVAERTRELEALYDVTAASNQAGDPQTLLSVLLKRSLAALRSPVGFILLIDEATGEHQMNLSACENLPPEWSPFISHSRVDAEWVSDVIRQSDPILITDTSLDPHTPAGFRTSSPLTLILSPLQVEHTPLGILGMARPAPEKFDLDEIALLVSIVNQVGIAVHTETLRQLLQEASVLEERQRLARDLHDSVTQSLYGLVTLTEVGQIRVESGDLAASADTFRKIGQSARQAIREMRLFIHQLRPLALKESGLAGALELRLAAVEGRSDIHTRLIAAEDLNLPLPIETALYHIAQEALNNALKHASARNVTVTLDRETSGRIVLSVIDDGIGFDPQNKKAGMGVGNMQSRARGIGASLEILSHPGQGTRVLITVDDPRG